MRAALDDKCQFGCFRPGTDDLAWRSRASVLQRLTTDTTDSLAPLMPATSTARDRSFGRRQAQVLPRRPGAFSVRVR